jgi:hypothetical protein
MIQRPAAGTFDLELSELAHAGKQSFAFTASAIFQHLLIPLFRSRSAVGRNKRSERAGGFLASCITRESNLSFLQSAETRKPRNVRGSQVSVRHKKTRR